MLHVIRMIVVGLIVGILARFFYPGPVHIGIVMSVILGIAGSFVGGLIGRLIQPSAANEPLHPAGFLLSIVGAIILIFIFRTVLHLV